MAFKSDSHARRTWDPETGWELIEKTVGPGYPTFLLQHPQHSSVEFWGRVLSSENISGVGRHGGPLCRTVFEVRSVAGYPGARATKDQRELIEAALAAFGALHNGPIGPLEVIYAE